jgi:hypothetical protein
MSVNKEFRKRLLEQRKIERKRSLSKSKNCKIKQLKKAKISQLELKLRNSSIEKIKSKKNFSKVRCFNKRFHCLSSPTSPMNSQ